MSSFPLTTASSLEALTEQYRAITNNLANVNTPGFKRTRTSFQQLLDQAAAAAAADESLPPQAEVTAISGVDFSQGALSHTGRALDLALGGEGFFVLETPDGPLYTRSGKFHVNVQRQLVDGAGRLVASQGGPITIPPEVSPMAVLVSSDGVLHAGSEELGKLQVAQFEHPSELIPVGSGCFQAPDAAGRKEAENFSVHQGSVESSNVSLVEELIGLITVTRLYQANIKSMTTQDQAMKQILDVALS